MIQKPKTYQTQPPMQAPAEGKAAPNLANSATFPPSQSICLIGASVRAAAESAKSAGYAVFSVDQFGDRDTLAASEQHLALPSLREISGPNHHDFRRQLAEWVRVMPIVFVGGVRFSGELLRYLPLCDSQNRLVASARQLQQSDCLREACESVKIDLPVTRRLNDAEFLRTSQDDTLGAASNAWLLKQSDHCGGLGVRWLDSKLVSQLTKLPSKSAVTHGDSVIQHWVPGRLFGTSLLSNGREVGILGTCRGRFTRLGDLPFVYSGSFGPVPLNTEIQSVLKSLGERLVHSTGFRGVFNVDWILTESKQPCVLEVNPRWSGSVELLERAWREWHQGSLIVMPFQSIMDWVINAIRGDRLPRCLSLSNEKRAATPSPNQVLPSDKRLWNPRSTWGKRIIFSRREQLFDPDAVMKSNGFEQGNAVPQPSYSPEVSLHDLPVDRVNAQYGEPLCTVIFRWDQSGDIAACRRYRTSVRKLSHGL